MSRTDTQQHDLIPSTLGEMLRLRRREQGSTIDQVAAAIRVRPAVLSAIEADDTDHIPAVYLKGYIRSYAQQLGIPPEEVEERIGEAKGAEPQVQSVFREKFPRDRSERWFKATSYVLASAVVIALVWQFTVEAVRFSQGEALPSASRAESAQPDAADDAGGDEKTGARPAGSRRGDTGQSHLRASIASMDTAQPSREVERRSVAEGAWAAVGSRDESPDAADRSEAAALTIATSADSWVEIVDGTGEKIEMDLLRAGSHRSYSGTEPFRLLLGRASSIELTFNGEPVDLGPHTRGNVARVTLGAADDGQSAAAPDEEERAPNEP